MTTTSEPLSYATIKQDSKSRGERNDCVVKALALVTGKSYDECHRALRINGRRNRGYTYRHTTEAAIEQLGYKRELVTRSVIGLRQPTVNQFPRIAGPKTYMVFTARHALAYVNGKVEDWTAGRRHRVKEVWALSPINKTVKPVTKPKTQRVTIDGFSLTAIAKWFGMKGFTKTQLIAFVNYHTAETTYKKATLSTGYTDGKNPKYAKGAATPTTSQITRWNQIVSA